MNTNHTEAYLPRQVLAGLIDGALVLIGFWQWYQWEASQTKFGIYFSPVPLLLIIIAALVAYRLICLLFFNKTLGMMLTRIVLLNGEEEPLDFTEKMMAAAFILYRGVEYYNKTPTD
jgi:uncharacterized RDD family membrane protein YckC